MDLGKEELEWDNPDMTNLHVGVDVASVGRVSMTNQDINSRRDFFDHDINWVRDSISVRVQKRIGSLCRKSTFLPLL